MPRASAHDKTANSAKRRGRTVAADAAGTFERVLKTEPSPVPPGSVLALAYALEPRVARALVRQYGDPNVRRALPQEKLMIELSRMPQRAPDTLPWAHGAWFVVRFQGEYLLGFAHTRVRPSPGQCRWC